MKHHWLFIFFLLHCLSACQEAQPTKLEQVVQELPRSSHSYNNLHRAAYYRQQVKEDPMYRQDHQFSVALELLRAGESQEAYQLFNNLYQLPPDSLIFTSQSSELFRSELLRYMALASFRLGEQENCIINHHHASCIIPLSPAAVHQLPKGSRQSIASLEQLLQSQPEDYESRYLLNLAYMTLGQYPDGVPQPWLISHPILLPAERWFKDVSMPQGLDVEGLAGGVIAEDFNNDGLTDLLISDWDIQTNLRLFLNRGQDGWQEVTAPSGLGDVPGGLNLVQADYNNDGWMDLLVLRGGWLGLYGKIPNTLLMNQGVTDELIPTFKDVTKTAGMNSALPTQTATWADFNNDGWLDLFVGNESAVTYQYNPSEFYLNQQDGTFQEKGAEAGLLISDSAQKSQFIVKGVASADYDHDGWTDLFVSTRDGKNFLMKNLGNDSQGIPVFEDVTERSGINPYQKTFTCWFWDYNNDGWEDLLVSGFHSEARYDGKSIAEDFGRELAHLPHSATTGLLYQNMQDGTFRNVTAEKGLDKILYMMGGNFGDIDNDGWLDFYCGNGEPDLRAIIPNRMFRYNGAMFEEISSHGFGHIQKGHGAAFADFDNDGDQDIYMVMGGFYQGDIYRNMLLENQHNSDNHHIKIRLRGISSNRSGIGSKIQISIASGDTVRQIHRRVNSGGSFGASSLEIHIGLGQALLVDSLRISWQGSGTKQIFTKLPVNTSYIIDEEAGIVKNDGTSDQLSLSKEPDR